MNCKLRAMVKEDLAFVLKWRNTEDVRKNMYTNHIITKEEHHSWWQAEKNNPRTRLLICELEGVAVGVVTFVNFTGDGGTATWAFYSGDHKRKGIGVAMEIAALNYGFDELRVRKLECEVLSFNDAVIRFHLKHGFSVEGVFREGYVRDGKTYDIYRLAMLACDWFDVVKPLLDRRISGKGGDVDFTGKRFSFSKRIDEQTIERFACSVDDYNPLHTDVNVARKLGFSGKVVHGMLVGSLFSGFFSREFPGPGTVYLKQSLEFHAPVIVGNTVTLKIRVLSHFRRKLLIDTLAFDKDRLCVSGQATVLMPNDYDAGGLLRK